MEVLFEGQVRVHDEECRLILTQTQAELVFKEKKCVYLYAEMLGAVSGSRVSTFSILLYTFTAPKAKEREFQVGVTKVVHLKSDQFQLWVTHLQCLLLHGHLSPCPDAPIPRKRFLILVNPASGKGQAVIKWNTAHPLFEACALTVICTG